LDDKNYSPEALIDAIEKRLYKFMGSADQFDDITMLAVKRIH